VGRVSAVIADYMGDIQTAGEMRDFSKRHRTGNRRGIIQKIRLTNKKGEPSASFKMGEPLTIEIEAEFFDKVLNPSAGVFIFADNGVKVSDYRTQQSGLLLGQVKGKVTFKLIINPLVFYPRCYALDVWISNPMANDDYDWIRDAIAFDVQASSSFMSGESPSAAYGFAHLPFEWKVD
jgi:hypothetical protein